MARASAPFVPAATAGTLPAPTFPNTRFRDGITESFAASPTYPGHLYLTYEDWDGTQMDVKFTQSTDGGLDLVDAGHASTTTSSPPSRPTSSSRRSPPGRTARWPSRSTTDAQHARDDPSVLAADVGRTNFCIDTSLQAYKDTGAGAVPVGANVRISEFTWDPEQPAQTYRRDRADGLRGASRPVHDAAPSSATTSASRSRRTASTACLSRRTTRRA